MLRIAQVSVPTRVGVNRPRDDKYKAVFIPKAQDLFERQGGIGWKEHVARQQLKAYMAATRTRKWLYILYQGEWPKILEPMRGHVQWVQH